MPRASHRSWKMTASFSRSAPTSGAMCRSSVPHGWFGRCPCPPLGADLQERPICSSPKSRCRTTPRCANSLGCAPKAYDKSPRPDCRWRKLPPDECDDTTQAKSTVCAAFGGRTTTTRPIPRFPLCELARAFAPEEATQPLFLSQLATVLRETPKIRLTPRREARSW